MLARFYDNLHPLAPKMNRAARRKVLGKILQRARSVCDLGCGTGTTEVELARRGLQVYAVDVSPTMCRQARAKARRAGLPVRVLCADLRAFHLPRPVDLVLCEFNPLNHLPRRSDMARAARAVWRALRPGGYFNMRRSLEEQYSATHCFEQPGFCMVLRGRYDPRRRKGCLHVEWFLPAGKLWRRRYEHLEDVWWTDGEIRRALRRAGFAAVRAWDAARVRPASCHSRPGYDAYYLARKPPV